MKTKVLYCYQEPPTLLYKHQLYEQHMPDFTPLSTYGQRVRSLTVRHNHTVTIPLVLSLKKQHPKIPRCQFECWVQRDQKAPSLCIWEPAVQASLEQHSN